MEAWFVFFGQPQRDPVGGGQDGHLLQRVGDFGLKIAFRGKNTGDLIESGQFQLGSGPVSNPLFQFLISLL